MKSKKLYHKNTNQEIVFGDMFHINGQDCLYFGQSFNNDMGKLLGERQYFMYVSKEELCLEWR